ncbi:MAG: FkbM family methyltransferase [Parabacteroides sp.]|nr:FkbM family methyltransferase [Parabacteroides sp.]
MLIDLIKNVPHIEEKIFTTIKESASPVVLFGAGELAWYNLAYLRQHGIEPTCICDNDKEKQGTVYLGLPVCSYNDLRSKWGSDAKYNIVVSVGPQYKDAIFSQLAMANEQNHVWYLRGYEVCGEKINYQYFRENVSLFEKAYALLADNFSRKVFTNVLNAKLSGDFNLYSEIMGKSEYFDTEVVHLNEHEVLLDVGAYKGDVTLEFVKQTGNKYDGIIAFEPDKETLAIFRENIARNKVQRLEIHNKGAWHKRATLNFHDGRSGSSRVSESDFKAVPSTIIEVDTIDNILNGRPVTYISMDIEGAEHNALVGGEQTIKKWRPRIAVCAYHKREDLFDLVLLLESFVPDYKFYLRHYSDNQTETVLYAI